MAGNDRYPPAHSPTLAKGIIVILVTYLTLILGELFETLGMMHRKIPG
ncbi:MAG: hypothetical protein ACLUOS_18275 [Odoribacter splanchnicus]